MEAIETKSKKSFEKSVSGIKSIIQRSKAKSVKKSNEQKPKRLYHKKEKGMVYLSHIPHGFYENEMTQYFKQFGKVTAVRVIRSKKTGQSKGCAFVEFAEPAVAKVVAETMNNYLMGKRILKAECIPPEKQKRRQRMSWNHFQNPSNEFRIRMKKLHNDDTRDESKTIIKQIKNFRKLKTKLTQHNINYDFFQMVDVGKEFKHLLTDDAPANIVPTKKRKIDELSVSVKSTKKVKGEETGRYKIKSDKSKKVTKKPKVKKQIVVETESESENDEFDSDNFEEAIQSDDSDDSDFDVEDIDTSDDGGFADMLKSKLDKVMEGASKQEPTKKSQEKKKTKHLQLQKKPKIKKGRKQKP